MSLHFLQCFTACFFENLLSWPLTNGHSHGAFFLLAVQFQPCEVVKTARHLPAYLPRGLLAQPHILAFLITRSCQACGTRLLSGGTQLFEWISRPTCCPAALRSTTSHRRRSWSRCQWHLDGEVHVQLNLNCVPKCQNGNLDD
jgi:hypothetical protein